MGYYPHAEIVNDTAKLIIGRLISRQLSRNPELIDEAKHHLDKVAERYGETEYVLRWRSVLAGDLKSIQLVLRGRDDASYWLRLSNPFSAKGANIPIQDTAFRRRLWRDARRLVIMGFGKQRAATYNGNESTDDGHVPSFR